MNWRGMLETVVITVAALALSLGLFALFIFVTKGATPRQLYSSIYAGGFGTPSAGRTPSNGRRR